VGCQLFSIQNIFRLFLCLHLLGLIGSSAIRFAEGQEIKNLPESYGYYFFENGNLRKIPETAATLEAPFKDRGCSWGILGLDFKPEIVFKDQRPVIFIYEKSVELNRLKLVRLWYFQKLRAADFLGELPPEDSFEKSFGVNAGGLLDFGKWTVVAEYPIKGGPIPNLSEMYFVRSKEKLPPGKYAVCLGAAFTSHPSQAESGIRVRAFEIIGEEKSPPIFNPVDNPPVRILNSCLSDTEQEIEIKKGAKSSFPVSAGQIICSIDIKGQRGGEIIEFTWFCPDGTAQAKYRQALPLPQPGKLIHLSQIHRPIHLLMPGKWTVAIKVYGQLVKCLPFYVAVD
jgi:hypothetical protein